MILICGTGLAASDLPLSTELDYKTVEDSKVAFTLPMMARKPDVISIYVNSSLSEHVDKLSTGRDKVKLFANDEELLTMLGSVPAETVEDTAVEEPEQSDIPKEATSDEVEAIAEQLTSIEEINDTDAELPKADNSSEIEEVSEPNLAFDMSATEVFEADMLKRKLAATESVLAQNRDCLASRTKERDEVYEIATQELEKQAKEYDDKLKEAEAVIESLKQQIAESSGKGNTGLLSAFDVYAEKSRAVIKAGCELATPINNIIAISAGSADSCATLYQSLALYAVSGYKGLIIDLTGDPSFGIALQNIACKLKMASYPTPPQQLSAQELQMCSLDMSKDFINYLKGSADIASVCNTNFGQSKVSCAGFYHDLALLKEDWGTVLNNLAALNTPVIIMLPAITSFVGRYLASYLGTAIPTNIATICAPSALYSTQLNLNAIPDKRVRLLAMNYIKFPATDNIIQGVLNKRFAVAPFVANTIYSVAQPTKEDFTKNVANNNKIWTTAFTVG